MFSNKFSPHNIGRVVCKALTNRRHRQTSLTGLRQVPHCLHRDLQICASAPLLSSGDLGPEEDIWVSDPCDHLPVASPGHQLRSLPQEPLNYLGRDKSSSQAYLERAPEKRTLIIVRSHAKLKTFILPHFHYSWQSGVIWGWHLRNAQNQNQ